MRKTLKLFYISGFLFSSRALCKLENYIKNEYDKENSVYIINNKVEKDYGSGMNNNNINIDKLPNGNLEILKVKNEALLGDKKNIDNKDIKEQLPENNKNFEEKILHKDICKLNKEHIEKEGLYKPNTFKNIENDLLYKKGKLNFLYDYGMELLHINKAPMNRMNNSRGLGDGDMSFLDISNNNMNISNSLDSLNSLSFVDMKSIHRCIKKRAKGERDWVCNNKNTKEPNICVSDRKVQLCTGNLIELPISDSTKEKFKEKLILAAQKEGSLLFEKFGKKYNEEFCLNLKWSYGDYGDIIKGTDMEGLGRSIKVEFEIDRIFKRDNEKSAENRKKWWEEISSHIWNAMIKEHKENLPKDIKACSSDKPSDELQINRWLMEWAYDTDYNKNIWYNKLDDSKNKCNRICPKEELCKSECKKYKTWIDKKNNDFTILSEIYLKYNKKTSLYKTAFEYLKHKWDKYKELNFSSIFDQLNAKYYNKCICQNNKMENKALYVKIENICKNTELKSIYGELYCKEKGNNKIWQCINENIKDFPDVCSPPRRQHLCLGNLDKDQFQNVKELDKFLNEIILGIRNEGKFLIEKYRRNMHENKYLDESACTYLNYSFDDYKNIILGKDMWKDANSMKTENILKGNFEGIKANIVRMYPGYADLSLDEFRKQWWDQNKNQLWEAISCEFYNGHHTGVCLMEDDDDNQYLHWFREWKNDFCIEQNRWNNVLKESCIDRKVQPSSGESENTHDVDTVCSRFCTDYDDWIINKRKEYKMQSSKYKRDRSLFNNVIQNLKPWEYLSMKCTECTCNLDTQTFVYPHKGYEDICKSIVKPYDPEDIKDEEFNEPYLNVNSISVTSQDVTQRASSVEDVLSIRENVHLKPFKPKGDRQSSHVDQVGNTRQSESESKPSGANGRENPSTQSSTYNDDVITSSSSLGSSSGSGVSSSGVDVDEQEHKAKELLPPQTVIDGVTQSAESTLSQHGKESSQEQHNLDGSSLSRHSTQDAGGSSTTSDVAHGTNSLFGSQIQDQAILSGESKPVTTSPSEHERSKMDTHAGVKNMEQVRNASADSSSEMSNGGRSGLKNKEMEGEEVTGKKSKNDINLDDSTVHSRQYIIKNSGDGTTGKDHMNVLQGMDEHLENPSISERGGSVLESEFNKLNSTSYTLDNNRIETTGENNIDGLSNSYVHDGRDSQRHRMNINNRSRHGSLESDIVVRGDDISNIEGEEEEEEEEGANTLSNPRNVLNNMNSRTYNIEEYIYRDVNKVADDIMRSYRSNRCTNELSSNYCNKLKKESLSNVCTDEDSKNLCCSISDYCMKFFNFNSSGYHSCMRKEFSNPAYKCFAGKSFSNMYYFAGGGLFFIILFLLGAKSSILNWSEDNGLNGTAFEEANFEDTAFEVTTGQDSAFEDYGENAYKIGLLMNQKIQSDKVSDYLEYHMDN
ncbi:erythrocyte binding antigen-165, putative [Plasmodium reichenowi]|uniref:Erythrocyte binding antigen-165, putative n=1 Tax=Plasmodium reichenowi TaxID=5854 RepID=A0A2P9D693_PLARE|nr:erythrocyte binding antigen-165, putative [Plasmodium reichenowi]